MNDAAKRYIHEAEITVDRIRESVTKTGSITAAEAGDLFRFGYEYPLKAIVAEKFGSVPNSFQIHPLGTLADRIGLAPFIPSDVSSGMAQVEGWHMAYPDQKAFNTLINSSTAQEWLTVIQAAEHHKNFIVTEVLSSGSDIYPQLFPQK